jgi:hypothetical protein
VTDADANQDARRIVAEVVAQLETARQLYGSVYEQVMAVGQLDDETRDSAVATVAAVATSLRALAPAFGSIQSLPAAEQPDLELVLLRLLTDSISVALSETPDATLLVPIDEVDDLLDERREGRS